MEETTKLRQQVADAYGISTKTLYRWLKKENIEVSRGLLTTKDLETIYDKFGKPQKK
jgi:predicted site-specific integrase-resolvase